MTDVKKTRRPVRGALAVAACLTVAAGSLAAPAGADTNDASFLNALNSAGINYNDPAATAALGEQICPMLVEPGKNLASVYSTVSNNGISPGVASFFTGIAISMYCPQMLSKLGNGQIDGLSSLGNGSLMNILGIPGL